MPVQLAGSSQGSDFKAPPPASHPPARARSQVPFFFLEAGRLAADPAVHVNPLGFLGNAGAAFGAPALPAALDCPKPAHTPACPPARPCPALNVAVFLLIGKTSALTMNVAGVLKDWMLIGLSGGWAGQGGRRPLGWREGRCRAAHRARPATCARRAAPRSAAVLIFSSAVSRLNLFG